MAKYLRISSYMRKILFYFLSVRGGKIAVYQLSGWYFINVSPCFVDAASRAFNPYLPVSIQNTFQNFQWLSASTLQRTNTENFKQIFPEKELRATVPISTLSDLYIPTIDLPILLQEICGLILEIYKSLSHMNVELVKLGPRPHNSQKRNT